VINVHTEFGISVPYLNGDHIQSWGNSALSGKLDDAELCIRVVDEAEMTELNGNFRQKFQPTNVLSFPADISDEIDIKLLGDIAICAPVVEREAEEQSKDLTAHWAHMVVHGCLHLIGMDHVEDADADEMEAMEIEILGGLGFSNPYANNVQIEPITTAG